MNNCTFIGRVGRTAETRHTQSGEPVTGWSLAVDSGYGDKKQTVWLDCSLWGKRGERVAEYITKGSQLGVSGELSTEEWEGKTKLRLRVNEVSLIGGKSEGGKSAGGSAKKSEPAPADDDIPW